MQDQIEGLLEVALLELHLARQGAVVAIPSRSICSLRMILASRNQGCSPGTGRWISRHSCTEREATPIRIEMLNAFEDGFHLIHFDFPVIGLNGLENVLQADGQITRIVDGIDEGENDGLISSLNRVSCICQSR